MLFYLNGFRLDWEEGSSLWLLLCAQRGALIYISAGALSPPTPQPILHKITFLFARSTVLSKCWSGGLRLLNSHVRVFSAWDVGPSACKIHSANVILHCNSAGIHAFEGDNKTLVFYCQLLFEIIINKVFYFYDIFMLTMLYTTVHVDIFPKLILRFILIIAFLSLIFIGEIRKINACTTVHVSIFSRTRGCLTVSPLWSVRGSWKHISLTL